MTMSTNDRNLLICLALFTLCFLREIKVLYRIFTGRSDPVYFPVPV